MARHIARGDTEETATERQIREAIQRHLSADDVLISGLRLRDNTYGDVEIDLMAVKANAFGFGMLAGNGEMEHSMCVLNVEVESTTLPLRGIETGPAVSHVGLTLLRTQATKERPAPD